MQSSTDIWFCAYLSLQGIKIDSYKVIAKGKVRCFFNLTEEAWQERKLLFHNSELVKYKTAIEQIKDLGF